MGKAAGRTLYKPTKIQRDADKIHTIPTLYFPFDYSHEKKALSALTVNKYSTYVVTSPRRSMAPAPLDAEEPMEEPSQQRLR